MATTGARYAKRLATMWKDVWRRRVPTTLALYLAGAWIVLEAVDLATGVLDLPPWTVRLVFAVLLALLPAVLVLSYLFDIKEGKVVRTGPPSEHRRRRPLHSVPGAYDTLGIYYRAWNFLIWPPLGLILRVRPGEFGLALPNKTAQASERAWWVKNLYMSLRRASGLGHGSAERFLIYGAALAVPFLLLVWASVDSAGPLVRGLVIGLSSVLAVTGLAVGANYRTYVSLRAQSPDNFADIVLAGRSPSDILRLLAWEIRAACEYFSSKIDRFSALLPVRGEDEFNVQDVLDALRERSDEDLADLRADIRDEPLFPMELRRLVALKLRAAELLAIRQRRLCDHVLQYSPQLHHEFAKKYVANLDYLMWVARQPDSRDQLMLKRSNGLLRENAAMARKVRERTEIARTLFRFEELHSYVQEMASYHSMSDATLAYARALAAAAESYEGDSLVKALRFLHRKQHAHPGFELHRACTRVCEEVSTRPEFDASIDVNTVRMQLEVLQRLPDQASSPLAPRNPGNHGMLEEALRHIDVTVETYFGWSRQAVLKNFSRLASAWFDGPMTETSKPGVVVTVGYSKTVRQTLKMGLDAIKPPDHGRVPAICVLNTHDRPELDPQRMIYELTSDPRYPRTVVLGSSDEICRYAKQEGRCMVVLGIEAFDHASFLQSIDSVRHVAPLTRVFPEGEGRCLVVLVAGGYKQTRESLLTPGSDFLKYHLRHVSILGHEVWDFLVSDTVIWGAERWRHRLAECDGISWGGPGAET